MPLDLVRKIIAESSGYGISQVDVGETGDAFMNPEAIEILRYIRSHTTAVTRVFTNFHTFSPEKIDAVLAENLLDKVVTNIDGATPETYRAVKGLDLETVEKHIDYFIRRKKELKSPVYFRIQALTLHSYVQTVRRVLGRDPLHVKKEWLETPDDFEAIEEKWGAREVLTIKSPVITLWAEKAGPAPSHLTWRERIKNVIRPKSCRLLHRLKQTLHVAPGGKVFLCCADFNFEIIAGDLAGQTVKEVVESGKRRELLKLVAEKRFSEIGGPCLSFPLCQLY